MGVKAQPLSGKLNKMFAAESKKKTNVNSSLSLFLVAKTLRSLRNDVFFVVVRSDVGVALSLT